MCAGLSAAEPRESSSVDRAMCKRAPDRVTQERVACSAGVVGRHSNEGRDRAAFLQLDRELFEVKVADESEPPRQRWLAHPQKGTWAPRARGTAARPRAGFIAPASRAAPIPAGEA
jgi:hypothetical protein